jgi:hypothetical protein
MATTTPNYGWTVPTSTDLVKDGATAIETLGDAIDASMNTALGTKKAGMVLLNTTSFSGVTSQAVTSVFSATYNNYKIITNFTSNSGNNTGYIKLRSGATDASSNYLEQGFYVLDATVVGENLTGGTLGWIFTVFDSDNNSPQYFNSIELYNPFVASITTKTSVYKGYVAAGNNIIGWYNGSHTTASSYDGFNLIFPGNASGTVRTYGFNN